jgi:hypothetical protein
MDEHDPLCPRLSPHLVPANLCTYCQLIAATLKRERARMWADPMKDAYREGYNDGVRCRVVGDWMYGRSV